MLPRQREREVRMRGCLPVSCARRGTLGPQSPYVCREQAPPRSPPPAAVTGHSWLCLKCSPLWSQWPTGVHHEMCSEHSLVCPCLLATVTEGVAVFNCRLITIDYMLLYNASFDQLITSQSGTTFLSCSGGSSSRLPFMEFSRYCRASSETFSW